MPKWKTNDYFSPKSWARIQEEKRDEELAKISASPLGILSLIAVMTVALAGCVIALLWMILR
jgi:hypothetical protein